MPFRQVWEAAGALPMASRNLLNLLNQEKRREEKTVYCDKTLETSGRKNDTEGGCHRSGAGG